MAAFLAYNAWMKEIEPENAKAHEYELKDYIRLRDKFKKNGLQDASILKNAGTTFEFKKGDILYNALTDYYGMNKHTAFFAIVRMEQRNINANLWNVGDKITFLKDGTSNITRKNGEVTTIKDILKPEIERHDSPQDSRTAIARLKSEITPPQIPLKKAESKPIQESLKVAPRVSMPTPAPAPASAPVMERSEIVPALSVASRKDWKALEMKNPDQQTEYKEPLNKVYRNIVVHHAAGVFGSPSAIQKYQMNQRGFDDIAYHFYIGTDGKISQGRDLKFMGAHAGQTKEANEEALKVRSNSALSQVEKGKLIDEARKKDPNYGSIGIVIDGNYDNAELNGAQKKALQDLLASLKKTYDIPNANIVGHKEVGKKIVEAQGLTLVDSDKADVHTVCPGKLGFMTLASVKRDLPADTEKAAKKYNAPSQHPEFTEEFASAYQNHSIDELFSMGWNYRNRVHRLENPDDPVFTNNLDGIFRGNSDALEQRFGPKTSVGGYADRIFYPKIVNLSSSHAVFGYRNRKQSTGDIPKTFGITVPLANELLRPEELKLVPGVHENTTVIGVDTATGKILVGILSEFKDNPTAMLSKTTRNNVKDIPVDADGNVYGKKPHNANAQYGFSNMKMVTAEGAEGSLPVLFKGKDGASRMGSSMGGSLLFESKDRKRLIVVSGTCNQLAKAFQLFKGRDEYVTIYNVDNGTYALGFQTKNHTLTAGDLKKYDLENSSGGHGLYLKIKEEPLLAGDSSETAKT